MKAAEDAGQLAVAPVDVVRPAEYAALDEAAVTVSIIAAGIVDIDSDVVFAVIA